MNRVALPQNGEELTLGAVDPAESLWTLAYYSSARRDWSASDLRHIAETAASRNAEHGVTGVLVHWDGSYFQVLEGDRDKLQKIYENHILPDSRHFGLVVVIDGPIADRSFSEWRMAAYGLEGDEKIVAFKTLIDEAADKLKATHAGESKTLKLLQSFIATNCERML